VATGKILTDTTRHAVSAKKYTTMHAIESYAVYNIDKNSYATHYAYYKNYS